MNTPRTNGLLAASCSASAGCAPPRLGRTSRRALRGGLLALACLAAPACGGGGGSSSATFGLGPRVPVTSLTFPTDQVTVGDVVLTAAFPNLNRDRLVPGSPSTFDRPVLLTAPQDGTDRIFIVEQVGRIRVFQNDAAVTRAEVSTFLDIASRVVSQGERGLLGLAFSPDYAASGELYVHYIASNPERSVISRFRADPQDPSRADPQSEEVILEVAQPFSNHNAGALAFGPSDGMLYVALGDGGSGDDPGNRAQDRSNLLGSMLRIDPLGGTPYAVPADNPFHGVPNARPEIWAFGLRNPWRFSFDRLTHDLWLGDVGQNAREEVDLVRRGDNLGWRVLEGTRVNYGNETPVTPATAPVVEYGRGVGTTVVGGYVYRGALHPSLDGIYLYADYGSRRLFGLVHDGQQLSQNRELAVLPFNPSSFGEDEAGEVYVVSHGGDLFRIEPATAAPPSSLPDTLSQTGIFRDLATLTPEAGVVEYDVNAPFWSDGATKRRWIALPGVARAGFAASGPFTFPIGTVLVKHFELALTVGDPASVRRLETRVLLHRTGGWQGFTYRWRPDRSDADLLVAGDEETFTILDPQAPGGQRSQRWAYPSSSQCIECHTPASGHILGVTARQLNRDFVYPARVDNQLRAWEHAGLFLDSVPSPDSLPRLSDPADAAAPVPGRARAWLDANCAQCHLPGGPTPVDLDLRSQVADAHTRAIGVPAVNGLGLPGGLRIAPGDPSASVLWERVRRVDSLRMPPLGSHVVDDAGLALLADWIGSTK